MCIYSNFILVLGIHTSLHIYNFFNFKNNFSTAVPEINLEVSENHTTFLKFFGTSKYSCTKPSLSRKCNAYIQFFFSQK